MHKVVINEDNDLDCGCFAVAADGKSLLLSLIEKLDRTGMELEQIKVRLPGNLDQRTDEILARAFTPPHEPLRLAIVGQLTTVAITHRAEQLDDVAEDLQALFDSLPLELEDGPNRGLVRLVKSFRI